MSAMDAFLEQNTDTAEGLTPEQIETLTPYAQHHAGGLFVLFGKTDDADRPMVKLHDDWGDDGEAHAGLTRSICVHEYNADPAHDSDWTLVVEGVTVQRAEFMGSDRVTIYGNSADAVAHFLRVVS